MIHTHSPEKPNHVIPDWLRDLPESEREMYKRVMAVMVELKKSQENNTTTS